MDTPLPSFTDVTTFIVIASLKGSVLIGLVLAAQVLFRGLLPANWRYLLWFTVVVALVMPVGFEAAVLPETRAPAFTASLSAAAPRAADTGNAAADPAASASSPSAAPARIEGPIEPPRPGGFPLLSYAWLSGVLVMASAIGLSTYRLSGLVRSARPASGPVQALMRGCMRTTGCRRPVAVLESAGVDVPMIAGQFRPVLLLPPDLAHRLDEAQLRHVFIHELMHLQRGDIAANWIVAVTQMLHWFNPVVWFAFFRMRHDRELACDAATLRHLAGNERAAYGRTLLQLNDALPRKALPAVALGMLESRSHLQSRIRMLVAGARHRKSQSFVSAALLATLGAAAFSQPVPAHITTPPPVDVDGTALVEPASRPSRVEEPVSVPVVPVAGPASLPATTIAAGPATPAANPIERPAPARAATPAPGADDTVAPLLAQLATAPPPDVDAAPDTAGTGLAALSPVQPEAPVSEAMPGLLRAIREMAAEIDAFSADKPGLIDEWDRLATECAARKDDSLFGTLSKPCREVRVVQIRGDVFRFAYACHVLGLQHAMQWDAWRDAVARQEAPDGVEDALLANAQELDALCNAAHYAGQHPGFGNMLADAIALKYYNPWRSIPPAAVVSYWDPPYVYGAYTSAGNQVPWPLQ